MFRADWNWWSNSKTQERRVAPPTELVGLDGACPAGESRGIALGMSECELIRVAGATDQIAISTNERGERSVVITYAQGERAGIYRFTSGLLVTIDRLPEPERPQRRRQQRG